MQHQGPIFVWYTGGVGRRKLMLEEEARHMITIDLERARVLLREAMETQGPNFIYNVDGTSYCYNVPTDMNGPDTPQAKTGCLVGTALKLAGVDMGRSKELAETNASGAATLLRDDRIANLTAGAVRYFMTAQSWQDSGKSWGAAVERAEEEYGNIKLGEKRLARVRQAD